MKLLIELRGMSDISPVERQAAEQRYREALEVAFGSPQAVWARHEAAKSATDPRSRDIARWEQVEAVAAKLALGGLLRHASEASFHLIGLH